MMSMMVLGRRWPDDEKASFGEKGAREVVGIITLEKRIVMRRRKEGHEIQADRTGKDK